MLVTMTTMAGHKLGKLLVSQVSGKEMEFTPKKSRLGGATQVIVAVSK